MKKICKTLLLTGMIGGVLCGVNALNVKAKTSDDLIVDAKKLNVENAEEDIAVYSAPAVPTLYVETFNTAVVYNWKVGQGGDKLYLKNYNLTYDTYDVVYREIVFARKYYGKNCDPYYFEAKSYSTTTNLYSDTITLEKQVTEDGTVRYGFDSNYSVNMYFDAMVNYVPTSFDQNGFIWNHGGSNGRIIKATIMYNDYISDIEVKIPLLGYKTSQAILNGVKFELRTGPNRCSIRTTKSDLSRTGLKFAFAVD